MDYDQINTAPFADLNGSFSFYGTETGLDFADFLLGVASQYTQNDLRPFYGRNKYIAPFAEDSWRVTHSLTLNLARDGIASSPGTKNITTTLRLFRANNPSFSPPRPTGSSIPEIQEFRALWLRQETGISRRASAWRIRPMSGRIRFSAKSSEAPGKPASAPASEYFTRRFPGETLGLISDNSPYGFTYTSPAKPLFTTPFVDASTGNVEGQRFPAQLAPSNASTNNPGANIDFSQFEPISAIPGYKPSNAIPYTESYTVSLQRQIGNNTLFGVTYVGNQAHRLLALEAANPGNPALCLSLSQPSEVAPDTSTCGPFGENTVYTTASGQVINGTRGPLGPAFGSVSYQTTIGNSNYNALQASLHHTSGPLQLFLSYTYSKSIDQASNLGDQVDPLNPSLSRALSSFDMRQNFVASYTYKIPFEKLFGDNRATQGWSISGITRFSTGLPVTFYNYEDTSLLGTQGNGINNLAVDELQCAAGSLDLNHNPRGGNPYFNTSLFSLPALGTLGNCGRRSFSGPGIDNYDMTLQKNWKFAESRSIELRLEAFNVFNHAQFYGPSSVDGNISSATFGHVVSATTPRLLQIAAKMVF